MERLEVMVGDTTMSFGGEDNAPELTMRPVVASGCRALPTNGGGSDDAE